MCMMFFVKYLNNFRKFQAQPKPYHYTMYITDDHEMLFVSYNQ